MKLMQRFVVAFALWNLPIFSWAQSPDEAFDQLVAAHGAMAGDNAEVDRNELVAQWVNSNDWQSLPLADKAWLHAQLLAIDKVDRTSFSVRWSGSITAPATREYVFTQHHLRGAYGGTLKLWINSQLVLDTTAAPQRLGYGPQLAPPIDGAYSSQPVRLVAGEAASFQVDYVYDDRFPGIVDAFHKWRFPMPVLLWEGSGVGRQIVPRIVFAPPGDFETDESTGLRAEYFNDPGFADSVGVHWEPGVQCIWNMRPVLPRYKRLQESILAEIRDQIVSPSVEESGAAEFVQRTFGWALAGLSADDRQAAIESLAAEATLLSRLDIATFASWMPHVAISPDAPQIELLESWSEIYAVPPATIAMPVGYGPGSYAAANYRYYREAGLWFNGPVWPLTVRLINESLEQDDGACNLLVCYIVAFSSRYEQSPGPLGAKVKEHLDDDETPADIRATWLIARAYARELFVGGLPEPRLAIGGLQEAMLAAQDSSLRFWLLQEWIVHLASTGKVDEARSLISSHADEFQAPEQVDALAFLQSKITAIEQQYDDLESSQPLYQRQQAERKAANRRLRLERRRDAAEAVGEDEIAAYYNRLLNDDE